MPYALTITLLAGVALVALLVFVVALARRLAGAEWPAIGSWRFTPTPLGLLVLAPLAAIVLRRFLPVLFVLPLLLPLLLRARGFFGGRDDGPDGPIDGDFRRVN